MTTGTFDPSIAQHSYKESEWQIKEDWYVDQCNKLQFSSTLTPADLQNLAIRVDALLTTARFDYAFVNQTYEAYNTQYKNEKDASFVTLKLNLPAQYSSLKLTVDEMKGVVANELKTRKWNGTSYTLLKLLEIYSKRTIFMQNVIDLLKDKKDLLITHSGILKMENSLSSMSANVPNPNTIPPYQV